MPCVDTVRARFLEATGSAYPRTAALIAHPRLYQEMLDMEAAAERGPSRFGSIRRNKLLAWDANTSAWDAWDTVSGQRVHLVTGVWKPPVREGVLSWLPVGAGAWVTPPIELSLSDLLPDIGEDPVLCAQVLVAAVRSLPDPFGTLGPSTVVRSGGVWSISGIPGGEREEGVAGVGRLAGLFGHHGEALAELVEMPDLGVPTVEHMLVTELSDRLVAQVHRIRRRPLVAARERRLTAVRHLAERLAKAVRPPKGKGCLAVDAQGAMAMLECDGEVLRGGIRAGGDPAKPATLGVLWDRGELDGHAVRPLLRLWSSRREGDEARRNDVQKAIGGDDAFVEAALGFMRQSAHLRVDRMLLLRG